MIVTEVSKMGMLKGMSKATSKPPVASSSGPSFPSEGSPEPTPVPPPTVGVADPEVPVSSSSPGDSDKENSSVGSFQSTPQAVSELVEIAEVDPEVNDEEDLGLVIKKILISCLF